jgi:AAA domain
MWHVRAEAQRQVRTTGVTAGQASALVDLLVDEVLDRRSVALAAQADNVEEPDVLRRLDGSSVYPVAGADLYTSQRILDAEARLVTAAGRRGGASVEQTAVDLALLEMAANGTALDAGQASLVRQMCTSGARVQLAIAPAGAGKTTAMRALTMAWTQDGGQVLGLARRQPRPPSSPSKPGSAPTHPPNSPGPYSTATCPTGRQRPDGRLY